MRKIILFCKSPLLLSFMCILISTLNVHAQNSNEYHSLFESWGGLKNIAEDSGISIDSVLTNDYIANTSGGVKQTSGVLGNFDLTAEMDTEKAGLWNDGKFFFYVLGNYGRNPTEYVGDLQTSNNIETYDTLKLYEAWYEHSFNEGNFTLLAGLHDLNSEFYVLDYSALFINSSFGIGPDTSQVGPSIFSYTSPAIRLKSILSDNMYAIAAVYDGIPGDERHPRGTQIKFGSNDGLFSIGEIGILSSENESHYKLAVAGWYHSKEFESYDGSLDDSNAGGYLIGESSLFTEENGEDQGLGGFFQIGITDPDKNVVSSYIGAGFTYTGILPSREEDVLGIGIARANMSSGYKKITDDTDNAETAYEFTYRIPVNDFISIQPDFQYIVSPSAQKSIHNATVVGIRTEIAL